MKENTMLTTTDRTNRNTRRTPPKRKPRSTKPAIDPAAIAAVERAIEAHPIVHNMLETSGSLGQARITEALIASIVQAADSSLDQLRRRVLAASGTLTLEARAEAVRLRSQLDDDERDAATWRSKLVSAQAETARLEYELAGWRRKR
jgi:hypothetical protein